MYHIMNRFVPVVMAGAIGLGTVAAHAAQPATQPADQDLQAQVNDLKAEVAQLKSQQSQQHDADVTAATQNVLAQADRDSKLFDAGSGLVGGWDPANYRFFLASDDGNFLFHPGFIMQIRYASSYRSEPSNWQNGFEIR